MSYAHKSLSHLSQDSISTHIQILWPRFAWAKAFPLRGSCRLLQQLLCLLQGC